MGRASESKEETFRRLATKRTSAVLERIRILGHCANPQLYEYSEDDVKKILALCQIVWKQLRDGTKPRSIFLQ